MNFAEEMGGENVKTTDVENVKTHSENNCVVC